MRFSGELDPCRAFASAMFSVAIRTMIRAYQLLVRPILPRLPFADIASAQRWVACFVEWYNGTHRHSAIRYVTPDQRHHGRERAVLARRHELYERVRRANPERWSGSTRNWLPVGVVVLNPERAPDQAAAYQAAA